MYRKRARVRDVWWDYSPRRGGGGGSIPVVGDALPGSTTPITLPGEDGPNENPVANPPGEPAPIPVTTPGELAGPTKTCYDNPPILSNNLLRGYGSYDWPDANKPASASPPYTRFTNGETDVEIRHPDYLGTNATDCFLTYSFPRPVKIDEVRLHFDMSRMRDWATVSTNTQGVSPWLDDEANYGPVCNCLVQFYELFDVKYEIRLSGNCKGKSMSLTARLAFTVETSQVRFNFLGLLAGLCEVELFPLPLDDIGMIPPPTYNRPLQWFQQYGVNNPSPLPTIEANHMSLAQIDHIDPRTGIEFEGGNYPVGPLVRLKDLDVSTHCSASNLPKNIHITFDTPVDIRAIRVWGVRTQYAPSSFRLASWMALTEDLRPVENYLSIPIAPIQQDLVDDYRMVELRDRDDPLRLIAGNVKHIIFDFTDDGFVFITQIEILD